MFYIRTMLLFIISLSSPLMAVAAPDSTQLAVWSNEAIIATYTYNYQNFLERQKVIGKYFTANGWINYSKAMIDAKLPETIKNNAYDVSAVATMPPDIKKLKDNQWQVTMPVLVVYKNPEYKQKQTLSIMMTFIEAPPGTGVRGLAITNLQATVAKPACQCEREERMKAVG